MSNNLPNVTCVDCGIEFQRNSHIGQPPKRCQDCRHKQKPNRGAGKGRRCFDCGTDIPGKSQIRCVPCKTKYDSRIKAKYQRANYKELQEKARAKYRSSQKHRDTQRNAHYVSNYGITLKEYESMLIAQESSCAICKTKVPDGKGGVHARARFNVDHDHDSGRVRGLLCWSCNTLLGLARDDASTLAQAIEYLARSK